MGGFHPEHTSTTNWPSQAATVRALSKKSTDKGYRHDPDGVSYLTPSNWKPWNGVPFNPCVLTAQQIHRGIFPHGPDQMLGLRDRFYELNPFADVRNPTVIEIENWNIEVIRHFRKLLGKNETTHPVRNDKSIFLRAAWATERAMDGYWDSDYPTGNASFGPCARPGASLHCGSLFVPSVAHQQPYLRSVGLTELGPASNAEGINTVNADIPWASKMSRLISSFLVSDGLYAHTGPFHQRELFGSAWDKDGRVLVKWGGNLNPACP
ncbi:MAG: hypothetical protein ACRC1D_05935 [Culicoidibacterales bacterium]